MYLQNLEQMREFLRLLLGDDWEILLILANAIAGPDATDDQIYAANNAQFTSCVRPARCGEKTCARSSLRYG